MVANYFSDYGNFSNIWCFANRRWLIISQRTRPLQSDGSLSFHSEQDHCKQNVVYYFPENKTIAFRWWLIISQSMGTFQTYSALQSEGGQLLSSGQKICNQVVTNIYQKKGNLQTDGACKQAVVYHYTLDGNF